MTGRTTSLIVVKLNNTCTIQPLTCLIIVIFLISQCSNLFPNLMLLKLLICLGKWPRSFSCLEIVCPNCRGKLTQLSSKRQRLISDKKLLISKLHVIEVEIYIKKCKKCYLIRRPDTLQYGLLNIGDVTLISLDIFYTLRNTVR